MSIEILYNARDLLILTKQELEMTNEEIQRTMDFILGQQAQIAASFQRQEEERKRDGARIKRLEEAFQLVAQLAQATETRLERLETSSTNLEARTSNLDARMEELAAAQAHADERLSALIDIVREDRNGKSN
jgi:ABC-type transporter Mla subunit MlaD